MVKNPKQSIDFAKLQSKLTAQFRGLDANNPSAWPSLPRYFLCFALMIFVVVGLWFVWLSDAADELKQESAKELVLREDFKKKLAKAANLETLRKQREQVKQYVIELEKQLPSKAEMDALLSDINQAGLGRSLQFELFRPGQVSVKEYYAELPIVLRVTGRYHDLGAFAADIANLSRIVTLNSLNLVPGQDGNLTMDATAKTYRYLDQEEIIQQRKTTGPGDKK
jgi:type IV pilus assembly protein PilO